MFAIMYERVSKQALV